MQAKQKTVKNEAELSVLGSQIRVNIRNVQFTAMEYLV